MSSVVGQRRALLIEVPTEASARHGTDVARMGEELVAWGFESTVCRGPRATRDGIMHALAELEHGAAPADALMVYFSGRGGRWIVPDDSGAGERTCVRFLVPANCDLSLENPPVVFDFELHDVLRGLATKTSNLTLVLDCCFTGTGDESADFERVRSVPERRAKIAELQDLVPDRARSPSTNRTPFPAFRGIVRLMASHPEKPAYELVHAAGRSGYLTTELCNVLSTVRNAKVTWEHIVREVDARIVRRRASATQRPALTGPRGRRPFSTSNVLYEPAITRGEGTLVAREPSTAVPDEHELFEGSRQAVRSAIRGLHERGIPTTHLVEGRMIKIHPDGRSEDLGPLEE